MEDPFHPEQDLTTLGLDGYAVATSTVGKRTWQRNGQRFHHLIDPRTGQPAARTARTWALAPTAAHADALSTAFFLMNEADIAALCATHPQLGAALVAPGDELIVHGALGKMCA